MIHCILVPTIALLLAALPCLGEPGVEVTGVDIPGAEVEDVPTPLTLGALLPPGGVEAVDAEFWMRIEVSRQDRPMEARFIHWHIRGVQGQLVCTIESGRAESKEHSIATMTYSKQGKLSSYRNVSHLGGRKTSDTVGEVLNNKLVAKTTTYDAAGNTSVNEQTRSLAVFEKTVPSEWFTIIAAYHIRKGSLSYAFARTDTSYNFQHAETSIEDVGTEEVQWEGKTYTATMLLGERTFSKRQRDEPDSRLQYLLLPNGEMMYMRNLYFGYKFVGERVTKEAIAKEFWLPDEVQGPEAEKQDAE